LKDLSYCLWFHNLKLANIIKLEFINEGISPREFWDYNISKYISCGINMLKAEEIQNSKELNKYDDICEYLEKEEIQFIKYDDALFPETLKYIGNPPYGLFVKGTIPDLNSSIAIIGARRASEYGKTVAYKFSYELATRGISVISGMARGVDSCSHKGCIEGKGKTIAVMGSGFKNIYPKENIDLLNNIVNNGCAITEFMPDDMPFPVHFPMRNRIISGLSKYVLVVEAGDRSGSLTTATLALEQGKDVFAIPGNIFSPNSIGTNKLIRDGAKIIIGIEDILEEYGQVFKQNIIANLNEVEAKVVDLLKNGATSLEYIIEEFQAGSDKILAALSKLECIGVIRRVYGNYYIIT
jgi:DNA processing protein